MKILMVTMSMNIGGAETHILELCRELISRGCEITLASHGGVYADELRSFGVTCVNLPLNTKRPEAVQESYKGLRDLIREGEFDIVHAHARIPAFITGLLHDRMVDKNGRKFRFVTSAHLNFSVNPLWRMISRWGEGVMAVSHDIGDYLVDEYGYPRSKIHYTINGVDTKKFSEDIPFDSILQSHGLLRDRFRIVYMSRLDADRADPAYKLISIAPKISEKYPNADIIIVGGGTEFDVLNSAADEVNKQVGRGLVTMTGPVSNTNEYCAAADIFIGVSRSALEAMSAAKPVIIAGNQGSLGIFDESKIYDAVNTNFCCRGMEIESEAKLFSDISALIDMDADSRRAMGEFNRDFIYKNYTASRMADDYMKMYEKTLASPVGFRGKSDVVLSGYYGFGNLGDESLLDIITSKLSEEIEGVKIAALTKNPRAESKRTGVKCVSRLNPLAFSREIKRSRVFISGGGSLFQDATSSRSFKYYAAVVGCAETSNAKTCIFANGIGPINDSDNKKMTKKLVSNADYVSVRDADSASELERLGVAHDKIRVTADPAFLIEPADREEVRDVIRSLGIRDSEKFIAVSLRPMGRFGNTADDPSDDVIISEGVRVCSEIREKYGYRPVMIPMQSAHDTEISREVAGKVDGAIFYSPSDAHEMIGIMSEAEFVVGMRLHSIIFASSAGVPVIGLSYDPKVKSLMSELGQDFVVDLDRNTPVFAEKTLEYIGNIEAGREEITASLRLRADEMRVRALDDIKAVADIIRSQK
ncbi:MAG: polysaccharide pyruvyl transferase CsaB [Ruminococcaceae bacterium]|nr:polysaccharide pyruvyl transferase CsaB [Oscillospiraceae bacterium]